MVKKLRKKYNTPRRKWQESRIDEEKQVMTDFGLKNKQELWQAESFIRDMRRVARELIAGDKREEGELVDKLGKLGLIGDNGSLEDVLALDVEDVLKRRLQTLVYRQGHARTLKEARQMIAHGHILIGDEKVDVPSYLVEQDEEKLIQVKPDYGGE